MTDRDLDVVIVGGGLAGLSLAAHLVEAGLGTRRVTVLEGRQRYEHDRVWCSWAAADHPFRSCIGHSWSGWRVRAAGREALQRGGSERYRCIRSGRLYAHAEDLLRRHDSCELRLGQSVRAISDDDSGPARIELGDGSTLTAQIVFDSRTGAGSGKARDDEVELVQDFLGWHVQSERAVFDPDNVTLMDFVAGDDDVRFVYVLPFSEREALVESTAFSAGQLTPEEHEDALRRYLAGSFPSADYRITDRERGRVPMSTSPRRTRTSNRLVRIGEAGGMVKSSTGYSFEAVQRWSRRAARDVVAGRVPRSPARRRWMTAMDRMFLAHMRRCPELMPELFLRMFERVPADSLVRFLSDRGSPMDAARVIAALPKLPMLGTARRSWRLWLRR